MHSFSFFQSFFVELAKAAGHWVHDRVIFCKFQVHAESFFLHQILFSDFLGYSKNTKIIYYSSYVPSTLILILIRSINEPFTFPKLMQYVHRRNASLKSFIS